MTLAGAQAAAPGPFTSLSLVNTTLAYRMRVHVKFGKRYTLDTGLDFLNRVTTYEALVPIDDTLIDSSGVDIPPTQVFRGSQQIGLGAYIDLGIDLGDRLRIVPGFRIDGFILDGQDRVSADPRIVAKLKLTPTLTAKAYAGVFTQPPQPEALDRRLGNPNVGLEHGYHFGLGEEWHPDHAWSVDSEIFFVDRRDLVVFTDSVQENPDGSLSYINFENTGHNHSYGIAALIKREISEHLYGWLSYTYSKSRRRSGVGDDWIATAFDQPHVLNAVVSWKPGGGWELGARFQLASGRPDTPILGATFDADCGCYAPVRGEMNSIRIPTFYQLDVRAEHDWIFERWTLGAYLDVINVLNTQNEEALQYDYRYRHSSPITSFPILPTIGVRGTW